MPPRSKIASLFVSALMFQVCSASAQRITVEASIPATERENFRIVGNQIYSLVTEMFHGKPPLDLPIAIFHNDVPITGADNWTKPTTLRIGTTLTGWYADQFVFQFAHEMGHVMIDPRRNSGFGDAICTALALEILKRFHMDKYRQAYHSGEMKKFPLEIASAVADEDWAKVISYLHEHQSEMDGDNPRYREALYLAALSILSFPVDWGALKGIAGCTAPTITEDEHFLVLPITPACMSRVTDLDCRAGGNCRH